MNDANEKEKTLTARIAELESQLANSSAGQDAMQADSAAEVKRLSDELQTLKSEKAALETALANAQSASQSTAVDENLQATIVRVMVK